MLDDIVESARKLALWAVSAAAVGLGFWAYPTIKEHLSAVQPQALSPQSTISIKLVTQLIQHAEPERTGAQAWATDMLDALKQHGLPQSRENVCAIIAVVDQESGFVANPTVPNLGKLSEKAVIDKLNQIPLLAGQAENFLNRFPSPERSFMRRIRNARTERDLDLAYRDLINELGQRYKFDFLLKNSLARNLIEGRNEIDTIGSMQVSVSFAVQYEREKRKGKALSLEETYQVRDTLYTRRGGLYYGALLLLGYDSGYDRKLYRFADFNAGRYASRNAAFQSIVSELSRQTLTLDGDLLLYDPSGSVKSATSLTEQAIRSLVKSHLLSLTDKQIRTDLMQEKNQTFIKTSTYNTIRERYQQQMRRKPPFAIVPQITLASEKTSRILTTDKFAYTVNGRYQRCMRLKQISKN